MKVEKKKLSLLSPAKDKCQVCATKHAPDQPHNKDSLYYQVMFYREHDRWPTWEDAMAHCDEEMKKLWRKELAVKEEK